MLGCVDRVAPTETNVLLLGESGTGKEAMARAIHDLSPRRDRPLIKVNCGAITPTLIESELFGHVKGSFTGAHTDRKGLFIEADGGTLFLDEIGDMPFRIQAKILRLLQENDFSAVLADQIVTVMAPQCMLWQTSPAATEMETRMMDWLRQSLGLPEGFAGVIQDSASSATLAAVLTS